MNEEIQFDIVKHIGILSESSRGWTKELNRVSWNGRQAKYDLREWAPDHGAMGKGITLSDEEYAMLFELLKEDLGG